MKRNNLTKAQAIQRIDSQSTNDEMVDASTVVFSTQWSDEYTRQQVGSKFELQIERFNQVRKKRNISGASATNSRITQKSNSFDIFVFSGGEGMERIEKLPKDV